MRRLVARQPRRQHQQHAPAVRLVGAGRRLESPGALDAVLADSLTRVRPATSVNAGPQQHGMTAPRTASAESPGRMWHSAANTVGADVRSSWIDRPSSKPLPRPHVRLLRSAAYQRTQPHRVSVRGVAAR